MKATWRRYRLDFTFDARTSRGAMRHKDTYFIRLSADDGRVVVSEVPLFRGLSADDTPDFEERLSRVCAQPESYIESASSAIIFGFESAFSKLAECTPTPWQRGEEGININGLIWMGDKATMAQRIEEKIAQGFHVLKLKIGGINFDDELDLVRHIRNRFSAEELELRLDANGSFTPENALYRLESLAPYGIHSLEQPIRAGQWREMAKICAQSPIPIALDEELIGVRCEAECRELVATIRPQYLILKPALCGGFSGAERYIALAGEGRWWATSALESNIGLYDIASWLSMHKISMPQGLGTGQLYSNNIASPLELRGSKLFCNPLMQWGSL